MRQPTQTHYYYDYLGEVNMNKNLILGLIIFILALGINACDSGGVSADKDAKDIVNKIFPASQNSTSFGSAKKYGSGVIKIKDFSITPVNLGKKFTFEELVIEKFDSKNLRPNFYKMSFKGLHFTDDMFPKKGVTAQLKMAGIDELVMDIDVEQIYKPATKKFEFQMDLAFRKLAELNVSIKLDNVDEAILDPKAAADPAKAMAIFSSAKLKTATVTLRNIGLLQKITKTMPPQTMTMAKVQLKMQADRAIDPIQKRFFTALGQFVDNKGTILMGANPLEPVTLGLLMNPATQKATINKLNISVVSQ